MSVICWIILGVLAGFLASRVITGHGQNIAMNIVLGVVGALFGGWLFRAAGSVGVTGFNILSLCAAAVGAAVLLVAWHAVRTLVPHA